MYGEQGNKLVCRVASPEIHPVASFRQRVDARLRHDFSFLFPPSDLMAKTHTRPPSAVLGSPRETNPKSCPPTTLSDRASPRRDARGAGSR